MSREQFLETQAKKVLETVREKSDRNEDLLLGWIRFYLGEAWTEGYSEGLNKALGLLRQRRD